jgi:hypothetical protein
VPIWDGRMAALSFHRYGAPWCFGLTEWSATYLF